MPDEHDRSRIVVDRADRQVIEQAAAQLRTGAIVAGYAGLPDKHLAFALALVLDELALHCASCAPRSGRSAAWRADAARVTARPRLRERSPDGPRSTFPSAHRTSAPWQDLDHPAAPKGPEFRHGEPRGCCRRRFRRTLLGSALARGTPPERGPARVRSPHARGVVLRAVDLPRVGRSALGTRHRPMWRRRG